MPLFLPLVGLPPSLCDIPPSRRPLLHTQSPSLFPSALQFFHGHLLESETYIGGHVECLESGIFRADIPVEFKLNAKRLQQLIDDVDKILAFAITEENQVPLESVTNLDQVRADIVEKLTSLRDAPNQKLLPLIYHLDVGAMYPNIILTNRLQPYAAVNAATCAACDFVDPVNQCQRKMTWSWRGKYYVPTFNDYRAVRETLLHAPLNRADIEKVRVLSSVLVPRVSA